MKKINKMKECKYADMQPGQKFFWSKHVERIFLSFKQDIDDPYIYWVEFEVFKLNGRLKSSANDFAYINTF